MKYYIISAALFLSATILYSSAYITSAIIHLITNRVGESILTSQTQPLSVLSIVAAISAILFLLIGLLKNWMNKRDITP